MIKNVKIASVWVNEEKEITAKKDGKKYKLCEINCKVSEDDKNYPSKYVKMTFFEDVEKKRSATEQANYFKSQNEGQTVLLDIEEQAWEKDDKSGVSLVGKKLSKAKREAYEDIKKEMGK